MITNELISEIKSKVNDNQKQSISGGILQGVLVDMVEGVNVDSVSGEMLEANAVTTDKIANEAVTEDKLSAEVQATIGNKLDKTSTLSDTEINNIWDNN